MAEIKVFRGSPSRLALNTGRSVWRVTVEVGINQPNGFAPALRESHMLSLTTSSLHRLLSEAAYQAKQSVETIYKCLNAKKT